MQEKPLISLCIKSFNQRKYIADALRGAFAQTYSPLEIVISDNHSTDGSDELIRSMIDEYKRVDGRHSIIYNRNETNIGLVRNAEKIYMLSHGAMCIQSDGDDISFPERAERIAEAWISAKVKPGLISHAAIQISESGCRECEIPCDSNVAPTGASVAYSKQVVQLFPSVQVTDTADDTIFCKRAVLCGPHLYIKEPLVYYRYGTGVSTRSTVVKRRVRASQMALNGVPQLYLDFEHATRNAMIPLTRISEAKSLIRRYALRYYVELQSYVAQTFRRRMAAWRLLWRMNGATPNWVNVAEQAFVLIGPYPCRVVCGYLLELYSNLKSRCLCRKVK